MKSTHVKNFQLIMVCFFANLISVSVFSQTVLEEIIVTATKRVESIQDVPVSVSFISEEQMSVLNITDMKDLSDFVPNFQMSEATQISNLYIRGLGSGLSHSTEQSVGMFVDGVYIGRATATTMGLLDVAGVEVLRGPQGTLFGKNTVAGALIVRTKEPTDEFEGEVSASYGAYSTVGNHYDINGSVSGPLSDNVSYRLVGKYSDKEGYVENLQAGPDGNNRKDVAFRGKLRWIPSDQTTVDFRIDYFDYETDGQIASELFDAPPPVLAAFLRTDPTFTNTLDWKTNYGCSFAVNNNYCPHRDQDMQTYGLTINHDFENLTLTSISAYQAYDYIDDFYAGDTGLVGAFAANRFEDYESLSQELRLTSEVNGNYDYILGLYYEENEIVRDQSTPIHFPTLKGLLGPVVPPLPPLARSENWDQKAKSFAAFGQLRWHFSDALSMILGARYSYEEKDFEFERFYTKYFSDTVLDVSGFPPPAQAGLFKKLGPLITRTDSRSTRDEDKLTGSFTLEYNPNDNHMLYYTLAQGHKSGGFDDRVISLTDIGFDDENSLMHEIGAKTSWLDGRLSFNVALFDISFDDLQVTSFVTNAFAFLTSNAGEATSQGVEGELRFQINDNWEMGGSFSILDAEYDVFTTAPCTADQAKGKKPGCVGGTQDLSGESLQFAPDYEGNIYASYSHGFNNGWQMGARAGLSFSDEFYADLDLDPHLLQDSTTKVNASLVFTSPDDRTEIALIGRNLTEEKVISFGTDTPLIPAYFAGLEPPRDITLRATYRF